MPRLNHRKAKTGCTRCKARKVKCDEARPKCSACARHDVSCEYAPQSQADTRQTAAPTSRHENSPSTHYASSPASTFQTAPDKTLKLDHNLEMRLMHNWTANTCKTLWLVWEYWCYQAPLIALEWRYVMDALLAISARHSSRQAPTQWVSLQGRMVPLRDPIYNTLGALPDPDKSWDIGSEKLEQMNRAIVNQAHTERETRLKAHKQRSSEMLEIARIYFDRALEGHMHALQNLTKDNIESVYVTSILICTNALAMLGDDEFVDPLLWFRSGFGIRGICHKWEELVGHEWMAKSGVFYGKPDLLNHAEMFDPKHSEVFEQLLTHGAEFENIPEEDAVAYRRTVSYIGLAYKLIINKEEEAMSSFRRFMGMPSLSSPRFLELLEQKQPRALVILAHTFALMKLTSDTVWLVRGLAERQIPKIMEQLPSGWKPIMVWPLEVMRSNVGDEPGDGDTHDILSFSEES